METLSHVERLQLLSTTQSFDGTRLREDPGLPLVTNATDINTKRSIEVLENWHGTIQRNLSGATTTTLLDWSAHPIPRTSSEGRILREFMGISELAGLERQRIAVARSTAADEFLRMIEAAELRDRAAQGTIDALHATMVSRTQSGAERAVAVQRGWDEIRSIEQFSEQVSQLQPTAAAHELAQAELRQIT
jgi:hypothetical protein